MAAQKTMLLSEDLDPVDSRILDMLQHDAKVTTKEIANKLGLTVTPVAVRIRKLEKAGYILRYVAVLNKEKIQRGLVAFTGIQLGAHTQAALRNFEKNVAKIPEVMECYRLTGKLDFLVKIAVRDMSEYERFLIDKLSALPDVVSVETHFVLSDIKAHTAYPLRDVQAHPRK